MPQIFDTIDFEKNADYFSKNENSFLFLVELNIIIHGDR